MGGGLGSRGEAGDAIAAGASAKGSGARICFGWMGLVAVVVVGCRVSTINVALGDAGPEQGSFLPPHERLAPMREWLLLLDIGVTVRSISTSRQQKFSNLSCPKVSLSVTCWLYSLLCSAALWPR